MSSNASISLDSAKLCASCQKPKSQACSGCDNVAGSTYKVFYCSSECQKADWTKHKELSGKEPLVVMYPAWVEEFILNISSEFREVIVIPKNAKREIVTINEEVSSSSESTVLPNGIFKVTLKNSGGCFAIDLAGAQHGFYVPVAPWDEYLEARVSRVVEYPHKLRDTWQERYPLRQEKSWQGAIARLNTLASGRLVEATTKLAQSKDLTPAKMLQKMLKMPEREFLQAKSELLAEVEKWPQKLISTLQDRLSDALRQLPPESKDWKDINLHLFDFEGPRY